MAEQVWIKTTCLTPYPYKTDCPPPYPYAWSGQAYLGDKPVSPKVYSHSRKSVRAKVYAALHTEEPSE